MNNNTFEHRPKTRGLDLETARLLIASPPLAEGNRRAKEIIEK